LIGQKQTKQKYGFVFLREISAERKRILLVILTEELGILFTALKVSLIINETTNSHSKQTGHTIIDLQRETPFAKELKAEDCHLSLGGQSDLHDTVYNVH